MKASIINKLKEINEKISNYLYMIEQAKQINHRHEHSISISENNFFGIAEHYEGRIKINNKIIINLLEHIFLVEYQVYFILEHVCVLLYYSHLEKHAIKISCVLKILIYFKTITN